MFHKMIAAGAIAAAAVGGVALLAPQAASAETQGSAVTLPAGNRVCLDASRPALYNARGEGTATAQGVKFTFLVRPTSSSTYTTLAETGNNATAFAAQVDRTYTPSAFPGYFRICARNFGPGASSVQMNITTDR